MPCDTAKRFEPGIEWRLAAAHDFDGSEAGEILHCRLAAPRCATGTDRVIDIEPRPKYARVASPSGNLECQPAGGGDARNIAAVVDRRAVNRPRWPGQRALFGFARRWCCEGIRGDV